MPTAAPIPSQILKKYSDSVKHSANLVPEAALPNPAPFDTQDAIGTDLAFTGDYAVAGNYEGFTVYDISDPAKAKIVSQTYCPGPQNDVTISGDLLFLSVDAPMADDKCGSRTAEAAEGWEGIRIFDLSDKAAPKYVAAVPTPCGSHTATLVPGPADAALLYVSSAPSRAATTECTAHKGRIAVVKVPLADPKSAEIAATPMLMDDGGTPLERLSYGGCHDITVFAARKLAAASCIGDGLLLDIADPLKPKVLDRVQDDKHFGYWHSAVFTRNGDRVVFSDEFGGGRSIVCDPKAGSFGGNGIYEIAGGKLKPLGYFKIPRPQLEPKTCSAHNGSLIPVTGRDVMVQGWYEGGVSVIDFTDPAQAREIAYFQREKAPVEIGGSWSAYYYNGHIYSSDLVAGLDILRLTGVPLEPAKPGQLNAQTQG